MEKPRSKNIKVCMLVLQHPFTDARIFKREARSLVKMGFDVTMVVPRNRAGYMYDIDGTPFTDRFLGSTFVHEGVKIVTYKPTMPHLSHMKQAIRKVNHSLFNDPLYKIGLQQKADIYHAHEFHSMYSGIGIKRALKATTGKSVKLIYDSHEITEGEKVPLMKAMLPEVDYVITVSDAMKKWYKDTIRSLPVEVIYNSPPLAPAYELKSPDKESLVACYEGYMLKDKGSSNKILDITQICSKTIDFKFKILGGTGRQPITIPNSIKDKILLCGWVDYNRIPDYMKDVDVGWIDYNLNSNISPLNYRYALPNKFFSYLNNGVPVVVNNCPEIAKIVRKYNCGLVIDHPNPDAKHYADAFLYLQKHRMDLRIKGYNARKIMNDKYSWEHMEKKLYKIYHELFK